MVSPCAAGSMLQPRSERREKQETMVTMYRQLAETEGLCGEGGFSPASATLAGASASSKGG